MALLSIREIATGYAGKSRPGSGENISGRFTGGSCIRHFTVFAFVTVLASVTASITESLCGHRLFGHFAAASLPPCSTSALIITPSVRVTGRFSSFCLGIWRRVGWFGWRKQRCCSGRAVLASAGGQSPVSPAPLRLNGTEKEQRSIWTLKGSNLLRAQVYPGMQKWLLSCPFAVTKLIC